MPAAALEQLVHKFAGAYLETRWAWPRRFAPLSDVSFLLTDPRSDDLDVAELQRLSDELQRHLFGSGEEGEVALLVFEGPHPAVTAFAALDSRRLAAALVDPDQLPAGGHLTRIRPSSSGDGPVAAPAPPAEESGWTATPAALRRELTQGPPPAAPPAWEGYQGVYFSPREVFFGDVVMCIPHNARGHVSVTDGAEHAPRDHVAFDTACIDVAVETLAARPAKGALIYVPISFTSLQRPSLRGAYVELLAKLPAARRAELAAVIYDVPRDPAFTGLKQARALLEPHVSVVDLTISDPGFEIEKLPAESVNSVTLMLPDGEPLVRLAAMRRFAAQLVHFKQRRIWPGLTNVRRPAEVEGAVRMHIPFLTGPAICSPVPAPVGGRALALPRLPMSLNEMRFPRAAAPSPPPPAAPTAPV